MKFNEIVEKLFFRMQKLTPLTPRFEDALAYTFRLHQKQFRKGTGVPYLAHLLAVTSLVLEDGGDEDQAIAALLHDGPEDQGGQQVLTEIETRFGERVGRIVEGCTDSLENPKPAWQSRKESYLQHLADAPQEVLQVSLADKLHNTRTILRDLRTNGDSVWKRFNGGKQGSLWYYRSLVDIFKRRSQSPMVKEFEATVKSIEELI